MVEAELARLRAPVRGRLAVAAGLEAVATALSVVPMVAVVEIGRRLLADPGAPVWPLVGAAAALLAVRLAAYAAAGAVSHLADTDLAAALRARLARQLAVLPLPWFTAGASARLTRIVQDDVAALHHEVAHAGGDLAAAVTGPVVIAGYLLALDPRLALLTLAVVGLAQGVRMRLARRAARPRTRVEAARTELAAATVELVRGIEVLKTFGADDTGGPPGPGGPGTGGRGPGRFAAAGVEHADAVDEEQRGFVRERALTRATVAPATLLLVVTGAGTGFVALGWTRPIDVVAFALLGLGLFELLTPLYTARESRRAAAAAAGRVGALLAEAPEPVAARPRPPSADLTVRLSGVRFGYPGGPEVLRGVDAVLAPGTVTALVGPSGSGKSTLAQLLARFHDPDRGAITLGGVDLRELDRAELYRRIGFLFQDTVLLRRSVRDNIALADPDAPAARVRAVAEAAAIHETVAALPRGYDSVVGTDARFSGGEAQRVSIARTLLADTPILVLDEATAAADPESEAAVQDALAAVAAGRTLLVVAHRLATVTGADQILVLGDGRITERGTHDELLAAGGDYARLWRARYPA